MDLIPPAVGQIALLLFFHMDGFGIKLHTKFYMPLNKESEPNLSM